LQYVVVNPGTTKPQDGQVTVTSYYLCSDTDAFIDASTTRTPSTFAFTLGKKQVIVGYEELVKLLGTGGELIGFVPYQLAYGEKGRPPQVPPKTNFIYKIDLTEIDQTSLSDVLRDAYQSGGLTAMQGAYAAAQKANFQGMYSAEDDLNTLGYSFLRTQHNDAAVAVFELNAKRFPNSWNAYDSLGDAYQAAGNKTAAIASYQQALKLNPNDTNATTMLKALSASGQ